MTWELRIVRAVCIVAVVTALGPGISPIASLVAIVALAVAFATKADA